MHLLQGIFIIIIVRNVKFSYQYKKFTRFAIKKTDIECTPVNEQQGTQSEQEPLFPPKPEERGINRMIQPVWAHSVGWYRSNSIVAMLRGRSARRRPWPTRSRLWPQNRQKQKIENLITIMIILLLLGWFRISDIIIRVCTVQLPRQEDLDVTAIILIRNAKTKLEVTGMAQV